MFRYPVESSETYRQLYDNSETGSWAADGDRRDWDLIATLLRRLKPHAESVLDFGCYTGGLLNRIGIRTEKFGVEPNREAAKRARVNSGTIIWNSLAEVPEDKRFDVVVACDVVEHLLDPRELMERLLAMTTDNGILIVSTGNADSLAWRLFGANWWYCAYPEHIAFISDSWLHAFLSTSNASLVHLERFSYLRLSPARWVVSALQMCAYGVAPKAYLRFRNCVRALRGLGVATAAPGVGVTKDHFVIALTRD